MTKIYREQMASMGTVALKAILVMLLPVIELTFLRYYLHSVLELRIGFPGFTDYELLLPAPLGFFAFIWALEEGSTLKLRFSAPFLLANLLLMSSFLLLNHYSVDLLVSLGGAYWWVWISLLLLTGGSGFGVLLSPQQLFSNPHKWALLPSLVMVFSLVTYMKYGADLWSLAVVGIQKVAGGVLALVGNDTITLHSNGRVMLIHHPILSVYLGQGCGGFDGLLFFLAAFMIFAPIRWEMLSPRSWFFCGALGLVFFVFLNGVRIVTLFSLAVIAGLQSGREAALQVVMGVFHAHLGYLIYAAGIYAYFKSITWVAEWKTKSKSLDSFSFLKTQSQRQT